jgi:tRNA(Ile)-lysidine synthetase-like protein
VPPVHVTFAAELPGARLRCRGHDRGVRELMRDAGVPPWLRETLPLIVDARGVALIPGVAVRDSSAPAGTDTEAPIAVEALWTTNQAD